MLQIIYSAVEKYQLKIKSKQSLIQDRIGQIDLSVPVMFFRQDSR